MRGFRGVNHVVRLGASQSASDVRDLSVVRVGWKASGVHYLDPFAF